MSLAFFDSNILVYTEDASALPKQKRATSLLDDHLTADTAVLSLQVLQEYFATITRKLHVPAERHKDELRSSPALRSFVLRLQI